MQKSSRRKRFFGCPSVSVRCGYRGSPRKSFSGVLHASQFKHIILFRFMPTSHAHLIGRRTFISTDTFGVYSIRCSLIINAGGSTREWHCRGIPPRKRGNKSASEMGVVGLGTIQPSTEHSELASPLQHTLGRTHKSQQHNNRGQTSMVTSCW